MTTLATRVLALPKKFWFILLIALLAQLTLIWLGTASGDPFGDVRYTYAAWINSMIDHGYVLGINEPWVYPFIAEIPLWMAHFVSFGDYMTGWFLVTVNLNMLTFAYLLGWGKKMERRKAAWFLIGCIFLCGPVALGRFEVFSLILTVLASIALWNKRESLSMQFFNLATWIKVAPVAAIFTGFLITNNKRKFILHLIYGTAVIIIIGLLLGGNSAMFSFVGMQSGRGVQVESTIGIIWLVQILLGIPGAKIYYDNEILTFQVSGFGVTEVASIMTLVQFAALAITIFLGIRAKRAGVDANTLFAWIFLTATLDLLVFNKVGSPQYELWVIGAAFAGVLFSTAKWKPVVLLTIFSSGLSWLIFPIYYGQLLDGKPLGVGLLIARNLAVVAILVWSNIQLTRLGNKKLTAQ
ncbi:MAG: glycosyltransferase 87 family protein [Actinomycetes bacterium]